jgi:hypothetical protein
MTQNYDSSTYLPIPLSRGLSAVVLFGSIGMFLFHASIYFRRLNDKRNSIQMFTTKVPSLSVPYVIICPLRQFKSVNHPNYQNLVFNQGVFSTTRAPPTLRTSSPTSTRCPPKCPWSTASRCSIPPPGPCTGHGTSPHLLTEQQ